MAAAVTALAAPFLVLAFSALLNQPDIPDADRTSYSTEQVPHPGQQVPHPGQDSPGEQVLREVLRSQRSLDDQVSFRLRRAIAEKFLRAAVSHLRRISPLFAGATLEHDGGAYEDTRVSNAADFDMYTTLSGAPLRQFELQRDGAGGFLVRLRPGANRGQLPEDLTDMLTEDGHLDAGRFRAWTTECVMYALRETAEEQPELRPVVYHTRGAPGVNLTDFGSSSIEVDFTAKLPVPDSGDSALRPAALRPCGTPVVPPDNRPVWYLYPATASSQPGSFSGNTPQLELGLLRTQPLLRDVVRLLKTLRTLRDWQHRFGGTSFQLKQAAFWWREAACAETRLLPATVGALRQLEGSLRRGYIAHFWFSAPTENLLWRRVRAQQLADEVAGLVETLTSGDADAIRRLFQM